jgi:ankyrin repeat protein
MMASMFGQTDVVKLLLTKRKNLTLQDQDGNMAITSARRQANPRMIAQLSAPGLRRDIAPRTCRGRALS